MPRAEIETLPGRGIHFMDITDTGDISAAAANIDPKELQVSIPRRLTKERDALASYIGTLVNKEAMKEFLEGFTAFHTRYFKSRHGLESAEWLWARLVEVAESSRMKITLERIEHRGWPQFSIIARMECPGAPEVTDKTPRVVISAHQDSISSFLPMLMPAPGADDDGSGTATVFEVFRILAAHTLELSRPLEFMFFSAEEGGLLGSQAIAKDYQARRVPAAVLHIDMDGFSGKSLGNEPVMALLADNTNPMLTRFMKILAKRYTRLPVVETKCGYACSDHYSWTAGGYASAALFESRFKDMNKAVHSRGDTVDTLDFEHMQEYVKVTLAYALHMTDHMRPDKE
jgi:leucyl aminopeptidase